MCDGCKAFRRLENQMPDSLTPLELMEMVSLIFGSYWGDYSEHEQMALLAMTADRAMDVFGQIRSGELERKSIH